jgi:tetratricopeptide (TPR) repeat protein
MFLQLRPEDRKQANTHYFAGVSYQKQERYDKAEKEYLKAIAIDPLCYKAYCNLGSICMRMGRGDEGLAFYEKAIEINPYDSIALFDLGMFYMTHDDEDKGLMYFSRAIASDRTIEAVPQLTPANRPAICGYTIIP